MTQDTLQFWPEVFTVVAGFLVLLALILAPYLHKQLRRLTPREVLPGSQGHREPGEEEETPSPDGYITVFAKEVEEGGAGIPLFMWIIAIVVFAWWVIYLVLFWRG